MKRQPPRSTRTDTLSPCTTLFRSRASHPAALASAVGESRALRHLPCWLRVMSDARSSTLRCREIAGRLMAYGAANSVTVASPTARSEEHTSELQSLMRISYAVFCLKKKKINKLKTTMQKTTD